jgi:polyhydroxyalkanoate synthesis regulator phasin
MTALKQADPTASKAAAASSKAGDRKPWKKKSPVEVVLDQANRLRSQIAEREEELKELRRQLQKFEEARKIFESA